MTIPDTTPGTLPRAAVPPRKGKRSMARAGASLAAVFVTAAIVAVGGPAAPAHAESSESIEVAGGKVSFIGHGNGLAAWDTRKDGRCMAAVARYVDRWSNPAIPKRITRSALACGRGHGDLERLHITEGTQVLLYACYPAEGSDAPQCSEGQRATA
jgi:hypothetical protein